MPHPLDYYRQQFPRKEPVFTILGGSKTFQEESAAEAAASLVTILTEDGEPILTEDGLPILIEV